MASPSTVLTRGFGSWGSVNLLPTLGYGIGEVGDTSPVSVWTVRGRDRSNPTVAGTDRSRPTVKGRDRSCPTVAGTLEN